MLQTFEIIPIFGTKTNVPIDDPSLFKFVGQVVAITHDVGGINLDYVRKRDACSKAYGMAQWDSSANAQATACLGLYEVFDGTYTDHIGIDNGKFFYFDSNKDPVLVEDALSTTFSADPQKPYSIMDFGGYVIFSDYGEHTPYKWTHGDTTLTKLIQSGTEYKFRYLTDFQNRIIGAYSDQTNGDLEIRWTDALPTWNTLSFPSANQLYKPYGNDSITGIIKTGRNCFLFGEDSISRIDYYPSATVPFNIESVVAGQGATGHHSIVQAGGIPYFFNRNYGFCRYIGGTQIEPLSNDLEEDIAGINSAHYGVIVGKFVPFTDEICWAVPLAGESTPTHLFFYNIRTGQWRKEDKAVRCIDVWKAFPNITWNDLLAQVGTNATWADLGAHAWAYYTAQKQHLVMAHTDGHLYTHTGNSIAGAAIDAYRIEPALDFGDKLRKDRLLEIWFGSGYSQDVDLHIYWRGGDTAAEVEGASWTSLGTINLSDPASPAIYLDKTERIHQIKWGTDGADEPFEINRIVFKYLPQGRF